MDLYVKLAVLGLVAGAVSSGTAIGWGLITAPMLLLVFQFPPKECVALSVIGGLGYLIALGCYRHLSGSIPWGATLALTLGSLVGGVRRTSARRAASTSRALARSSRGSRRTTSSPTCGRASPSAR